MQIKQRLSKCELTKIQFTFSKQNWIIIWTLHDADYETNCITVQSIHNFANYL
jgi:hypothetical protein